MQFQKRMISAREALRRHYGESPTADVDVAGVEMMLYLTSTARLIHDEIYAALEDGMGLTEGKFTMLMVLLDKGSLPVVELSAHMGVTPATASIMLRRMLSQPVPLVTKRASESDARSFLIELTDEGRALLERALPDHYARVTKFASNLSHAEQEELISLLRKLHGDGAEEEGLPAAERVASRRKHPPT